jgi:dolichyl-phosphate-mannose-protein mannosyltransferase
MIGKEEPRFLPSWSRIPAALAAALTGQAFLFWGWIGAGALFYLAAAALIFLRREKQEAPAPELSRVAAAVLLAAILVAALLLRRVAIGSIPWGLNNDEGIEGLIACRFLEGEKIAPFSSIGLSRETLYHLLLLPLFRLLGPGMGALRLLSLLCALATLPVLTLTGREFFGARTGLLAAALLAFSPWHLLYSRTGFRSILLPLFVLAAFGCFRRALERRTILWFAVTGGVLGIGMYSYTSFRIVPPILLAWALLRRLLFRRPAMTWKETLAVAVPFLLLMIPQLAYGFAHPNEFLARGSYVLSQTPQASVPANLLFSLLLPVYYPARYGVMQSLYYFGDGVSLVYAAVGRTPETVVSAALMACGILLMLERAFRRRDEAAAVLLLGLGGTLLTVGLAGPSLTRLLGNLPLLCLAGGAYLEETGARLSRRFSRAAARACLILILAAAAVLCGEQYFARAGRSPRAMFYYAAPETIMGLYAVSRSADHPVVVLYTEEPETLEFLTFPRRDHVILERDPARLDPEKIWRDSPRVEFVVENSPRFAELFQALKRRFPEGEPATLTDRLRPSGRAVAVILNVGSAAAPPSLPGSGRESEDPAAPPGNGLR